MEIQLKELFNKHKNIPCVIVGGSQTMMDFDYKKFKGIKISIGSSILRIYKKFNINYLVTANNEFPVPEIPFHLNFLNKLNKSITWVTSDTACYSALFSEDRKIWDKKLKINYCKYDDRHFKKKNCSPKNKCCEFLKIYPNRETIYESLFSFYNEKNSIKKTGTTVAEIGLVLALILGCNPIFLQGVDIPKKHYHGKQLGQKYYGYQSKFADNLLDKTTSFLRIKYFFFYLRNARFKPYLTRLYQRIVIGKNNSFFSLTNFHESRKIFYYLGKFAKKKNTRLIVLSKNSTLRSVKNFEYLDSSTIKEKFANFFK